MLTTLDFITASNGDYSNKDGERAENEDDDNDDEGEPTCLHQYKNAREFVDCFCKAFTRVRVISTLSIVTVRAVLEIV